MVNRKQKQQHVQKCFNKKRFVFTIRLGSSLTTYNDFFPHMCVRFCGSCKHTHTHTHTQKQTYVHTHTYTHTEKHTYTYMHTHTPTHTYTYTHTHTYHMFNRNSTVCDNKSLVYNEIIYIYIFFKINSIIFFSIATMDTVVKHYAKATGVYTF